MLDYAATRAWVSPPIRQTCTPRDTILYALALGMGDADLAHDAVRLRHVYERDLVALPTMAAVLASPGFWMRDRAELGIDHLRVVHGEQGVILHAPLPVAGELVGQSRVVRLVDKGAGKGAILTVEKDLRDAAGQLLATTEQVLFLRGDGGCAAAVPGGGDTAAAAPAATPDTPPAASLDLAVRPDAAALYRLCGDLNPLHIDPAVAQRAGFNAPILHGLATWGMACRAVLALHADGDSTRLAFFRARMSAPVYPGDVLRVETWQVDGAIAFRVRVPARAALVLSHGRAGLHPAVITASPV